MSTKTIRNIEAEVRQSRARLANRWNDLELEISGLANSAKEEVHQKIEQAKESVSLRHQIAKRPWAMMAGSVLTGIALSRLSPFRSLAVIGVAAPLLKDALHSYTGQGSLAPSSATGTSSPGLLESLRSKAIKSLIEVARETAKKHLPPSIAPLIDQAIAQSGDSFLAKAPQTNKGVSSPNRVMEDDKGDSLSIH